MSNTNVTKQFFGWLAETSIYLLSNKVLVVTTCKRSNGKVSTNVSLWDSLGKSRSFSYGTYSEHVMHSIKVATKAAIVKAHHSFLTEEEFKKRVFAAETFTSLKLMPEDFKWENASE